MAEIALNRRVLAERGKRLEYFTIAWNTLEGLVAVICGAMAGSVSLVAFGVDSFIEVTSGSTLFWRMSVDADEQNREHSVSGLWGFVSSPSPYMLPMNLPPISSAENHQSAASLGLS